MQWGEIFNHITTGLESIRQNPDVYTWEEWTTLLEDIKFYKYTTYVWSRVHQDLMIVPDADEDFVPGNNPPVENTKQIRLVKHGGKKTVNQHNFLLYQLQIRDLTIGPMFGHEDIWIPVHLFFWIG